MPQNFNMMHDTWWDVAWCMMHDPWSMRQDYTWWDPSCRSESSNYKLGRLDKEKFADHTQTHAHTHGQYHIWRQARCLKIFRENTSRASFVSWLPVSCNRVILWDLQVIWPILPITMKHCLWTKFMGSQEKWQFEHNIAQGWSKFWAWEKLCNSEQWWIYS